MTTRPSSGSRRNAPGVSTARLGRRDERGPHDEHGEDRQRGGEGASATGGRGAAGGARHRLPQTPDRRRHSHHTSRPNDSASRASATASASCVNAERQHVRGGDRQHDPLRRGDDLAPVAARQRRAHPRERPAGGEERVARRADREHPGAGGAGDVDAEHEDQERVDLAVEAARRAATPSPCAARSPSTAVERERDRGERHERRGRRWSRRTSRRSAPRRRRRASPA